MRSSLFTNCDDCLYLSYVSFIQPGHVVYVHITSGKSEGGGAQPMLPFEPPPPAIV